MNYRSHSRTILGSISALTALATMMSACGGGDSPNDDNGTSTGGASTGGIDGNGTGSVGNSGGSGTGSEAGTGGSGTGGNGTGGDGTGGDGTGGSGGGNSEVPGTDNYDCSEATGVIPPLVLAPVASGFDSPVLVTHAPNDTTRLFVVERRGNIKIVKGNTTNATPFLDIENKVLDESDNIGGYQAERGLLGLAFHPNYAENGLFYVHYSARTGETDYSDGTTIIAEYSVSAGNADVAELTERVVLTLNQPATNHNGGTIAFGGDSHLYIALGDGGAGGAPAQNSATLLGTIARINPLLSGDDAYTIPAGNLKDTLESAAPEVWSYGLRNPYRMNFDGCTGDLYIGDVGQDTTEEVNIEKAGEGLHNYGWPVMEGLSCVNNGCDQNGLTLPAFDYPHGEMGAGAVVGGAVYRGSAIPALRGTYFYGDQVKSKIWSTVFDRDAESVSDRIEQTDLQISGPAAIQNGGDGEIYVVSLGGGQLYRLEAE